MTADVAAIKAFMDANPPPVEWPDPKPLPSLPPVAPFDPELLPPVLRIWAMDIAERMQCPADFIAVTAMVAAGSVIGRKIAIRPQMRSDWAEVPNPWGMCIGRPGVMKSPAMQAALSPILRLNALASDANRAAMAAHAARLEMFKAEKEAKVSVAKKKIKSGAEGGLDGLDGLTPPEPPLLRRYVLNDASYEKAGEVAAQNPTGFMMYRDEIVAFLKPLDRDENAAARGFFLTAWNGKDSYTFDRIGRGTVHIEACCVSVLGSTQPGKLAAYLRHAVRGGAGDDGFAQRFGLLVWPDISPEWRDVDRYPDGDARRAVNLLFDRLDTLDPDQIGAERDQFDPLPFLRLDADALAEFRNWREAHERRVRSGDLHPAMESHLAKYRGVAPKLALILHLADGGVGPIAVEPLVRALAWAEYLETHALRAYASVTMGETNAARAIVAKLRSGDLPSPFTARDVHQPGWSGLTDIDEVGAALALLVDLDWLAAEVVSTGGRPKTIFTANPKGLRP